MVEFLSVPEYVVYYSKNILIIAENPREIGVADAVEADDDVHPPVSFVVNRPPSTSKDLGDTNPQQAPMLRFADIDTGRSASPAVSGRVAPTAISDKPSELRERRGSPPLPPLQETENFSDEEDLGVSMPNTMPVPQYILRKKVPAPRSNDDIRMPDPTFIDAGVMTAPRALHSEPPQTSSGVSLEHVDAPVLDIQPTDVSRSESENDGNKSELSQLLQSSRQASVAETDRSAARTESLASDDDDGGSLEADFPPALEDDGGSISEPPAKCASVLVVSTNLACRAFTQHYNLDRVVKKLIRQPFIPADQANQWPEASDFELPSSAILQRFELPPSEVILDMHVFPASMDADPGKEDPTLAFEAVITTTGNCYELKPKEILRPSNMIRRLVIEADAGSYSLADPQSDASTRIVKLATNAGSTPESSPKSDAISAVASLPALRVLEGARPLADQLRSRVAAADRVALALGLDAGRIFEDMADTACNVVQQLEVNGALQRTHPLLLAPSTSDADLQSLTVTDIRTVAAMLLSDDMASLRSARHASPRVRKLLDILSSLGVEPRQASPFSTLLPAPQQHHHDMLPPPLCTPMTPEVGVRDVLSTQRSDAWAVQTPKLALFLSHPLVTALLLRAYALYSLSWVSTSKPVIMLTQAGRPDLAVAFAAGALEFTYLYPCALRGVAPPLPPISLWCNKLPPADRPRIANLLIQCQVLAWPARSKVEPQGASRSAGSIDNIMTSKLLDCHAYSYAMSPTDFRRFLIVNTDYVVDRATTWLIINGLVYEALIIAHHKSPANVAAGMFGATPTSTRVLNDLQLIVMSFCVYCHCRR